MSARPRHPGLAARLARHALLMCTAGFVLLPFFWMLSLSLKPPEEIFSAQFHFLPQRFAGFENFRIAITSAPMLRFLINGFFVCGAILAMQLMICVPCAYALAKLDFRGAKMMFSAVLIGLLIPHQALAIPHFIMLHALGLLDSYGALILPWIVSCFGIFLLRQFFRTLPDDVLNAARLDGMGEFEIIWRIATPMITPALVSFGIFSVVAHWNDLFWPLIAIRNPDLSTPALGILLFRDDEAGQFLGPLMAGGIIIVAPLLLAFLLAQRRFIDGLAASALK
jgi:multiple sugar transport system permease protein